jgi:hypothetical protein
MAIELNGTLGITTPGLTNTGTETIVNLTTTGNTILGDASTDTLNVGNGGLIKDASGNVGVGVTPSVKLDVSGSAVNSGVVKITNAVNTGDVNHGALNIINSVAHATGNDARVMFSVKDSTNTIQPIASMGAISEDGDFAGQLQFNTRTTAGAFSTKMTLDASGHLLLGTTTKAQVWGLFSLRNTSNTAGQAWGIGPDTANALTIYNQATVGVYINNGGTSWVGTSDERLKTNLVPIQNATQKIASLRAVTGRFKTDKEGTSRSFLIAQDVQAVFPEAVTVQKDEIGTLGIAYTDVIPLLIAGFKEQQAMIDELKAKVAALEAA